MGPPDGYDNTKDDAREITRASTYGLAQRSSALVRRGLHDLSASDIGTFVELGKALTSALQLDFSLTTLTLLFAIEVCFRRLRASDRHTPFLRVVRELSLRLSRPSPPPGGAGGAVLTGLQKAT